MDKLTDINTRIKNVRKVYNLTQEVFANKLSVDRVTITQIEGGKILPTLAFIGNLTDLFNIRVDWLFDGQGEMFRHGTVFKDDNSVYLHPIQNTPNNTPNSTPNGKNYPEDMPKATWLAGVEEPEGQYNRPPIQLNYPDTDSNTKLIPYIDTRAAAGLPASYENVGYWQELPTVPVAATDFKYGTYIAIQVAGDSMQPRLNPGDILFAKFLETPQDDIRDNYVHIVVTREGAVVKRLLNRLKDKGFITLKSDNPTYPAYTEKHDNILQVWRVEAFTSFNLANPVADVYKQLNDHESRLVKLEKSGK